MRALHLRIAVLPAAVMALLGAALAVLILAVRPSAAIAAVLFGGALAAALAVLAGAAYAATGASRRLGRQVAALRAQSARSQEGLLELGERVQRGERPELPEPEPVRAKDADPLSMLGNDLAWERRVAEQTVLKAAGLASAGDTDQRVEVFVNLAWRMQSLVHREIQLLDDLEAQVEDPELLKGLFTVDHLATRMRRQSESLAVLGGAVSRRQWTRPVTMHEVLRAAVAEVEQYSRVKVAPPVDGILQGSAVADVIHLIAELVENATKFSAPHTQVLLRAQYVTAGIAIEVEDRGLGMLPADRDRMNGLLANPGLVNISELLRDGRIGLFVVSSLARRHGIRIQLQANIFGGIQAVIVLPHKLIETGRAGREDSNPDPAPAAEPPAPAAGQPQLPVRTPAVSYDAAPGLPGGGQYVTGGEQHGPLPTVPAAPAGPAADLPAASGSGLPLPPGLAPPAAAEPPGRWPPPGAQPGDPAQPPPDQDIRPPLPKRQAHTSLAPQLREAPQARRDQPPADQIPGLMAAFQGGFSRAEEESPSDGD